ncbi:MAG TPA: 50S ribosomal protein L9 [Erysipelotrichaceae bacterium]|nr:50S ribosomal protein L9 [Erysipelotrichaceae bacterium]
MKVILLTDVKKVGKKDQVVEVSDGYAVNYLFPRKLAVQVSKKSVEVLESQQQEKRDNEAKLKREAQEIAKALEDIILEFQVKTGREGKLFGAVSSKSIMEELKKVHNIDIDRRKLLDKGPFDLLGYHELKVELYKGVIGKIRIQLIGEDK